MEEEKRSRKLVAALVILVAVALALPVANLVIGPPTSARLAAISTSDPQYAKALQIMRDKCAACHTPDAPLPFYTLLPGAGAVVREDAETGLKYLDLAAGLADDSERPSEVALAKLEYAIEQKTMPPSKYVALHWDALFSSADGEAMLEWIRQTRARHYATAGLPAELQQQVIQPLPTSHSEKAEKVVLGKALFNDKRLSKDGSLSCASCHGLDKGGTDREAVATGVGGAKGPINSPTVYNAVFNVKQFWDGRAADLKDQAAGPVENPIEMAESWDNVPKKLIADAQLKAAFEKEYPAGISKDTITEAIAVFEKTLITPNCRFDRFLRGDATALDAAEQAGWRLFKANGCATCHCGRAMGGQSFEPVGRAADYFGDRGKVKEADYGRFNATKREADRYKLKVPTLRNVALTFPYFHDAAAKELKDAVRLMAKYQYGKELSADEIAGIVAFLKTLTGEYEGKPL
ncbi:MAG: cytochrome c peroxidase [Phycisphaerae bacterium]